MFIYMLLSILLTVVHKLFDIKQISFGPYGFDIPHVSGVHRCILWSDDNFCSVIITQHVDF